MPHLKINNGILFFLCFINSHHIFTMDIVKKEIMRGLSHAHVNLLEEVKELIWNYVTESPESVTKAVNNLAQLDTQRNVFFNESIFCKRLIKDISKRFCCSDEKVALGLQIKESKRIMTIQEKIFPLCSPYSTAPIEYLNEFYGNDTEKFNKPLTGQPTFNVLYRSLSSTMKYYGLCLTQDELQDILKKVEDLDKYPQIHALKKLCDEGADLEFTYDSPDLVKKVTSHVTPFMLVCSMSARIQNDECLLQLMQFFVDKHKAEKININAINNEGVNAFMIAFRVGDRWIREYFRENNELIKDYINHQDIKGNTAFMHYILDEKDCVTDYNIEWFLNVGTDTTIANYAGMTPLTQLEQRCKQSELFTEKEALNYFKSVIEKTNAESTHAPQ